MAQTHGRKHPPVAERLAEQTYEFDFFQAVRLLEWIAWETKSRGEPTTAPIGEDARPNEEMVRFRVAAGASFPAAAMGSLVRRSLGTNAPPLPAELSVSFLGLIGPSGVLPHHYTTEAIARRQNQDPALAEFFDIFQHRAVSLFYRAWRKYRLPFELEVALRRQTAGDDVTDREDDPFTFVLRCLVGLGTERLANRMEVADETPLYYAGHFTHAARSAVGLARMLSEHFRQSAAVLQFSGRWLTLPPDQRTAMPSGERRQGAYCSLGRNSVVGPRVWDVQTRFRIRLGPMRYGEFLSFMPGEAKLRQLSDLVRLYVGPALEFEVQPVLRREEVPTAQLAARGGGKSMLTRNSWLASSKRTKDAEEAVFLA